MKQSTLSTLDFLSEHEKIINDYNLQLLSDNAANKVFGEKNLDNMKEKNFLKKLIFRQNENYIFEVIELSCLGNNKFNNGLVLSDAQKEVFGFDKDLNIIFIIGNLTSKRSLKIKNKPINQELILEHELQELKYWSKVEDRLPFVPRPETIAFFQKQNYDIMQVLDKDEEILTREFIRHELIHHRADYDNLGNKKINRGIVIATFDKIDLEEELKQKLKRAYIKAIKILNLLYLLDKKQYFDKEYNIGLAIQNISGLTKFIIENSPQKVLSFLSKLYLNIISQILEEDFLEILNNPEEKIKEIGLKNKTKYKIDKLKINTGEGLENWRYPEIDIDGYFSQKIWVKTTIKLNNLDTHLAKYFNKILNQVRKKLNEEITISYERFTGLENELNFYLDLGNNYFSEEVVNIDINIKELNEYWGEGGIYSKNLERKVSGIHNVGIKNKFNKIGKQAYEIVQQEILKDLDKKKEKLKAKQESLGKTKISVFDDEEIFNDNDETLELKEIDFSDIVIDDYELFTTVEEFKIAIEEYYKFYDIEISIEEMNGLTAKQKQIIVKQENGEVILDMTFDLDSNKPIEFHFHSFCEGKEEEIQARIMDYVKANGVIDFKDIKLELDEVLTQRQNETTNQENYGQNRI